MATAGQPLKRTVLEQLLPVVRFCLVGVVAGGSVIGICT